MKALPPNRKNSLDSSVRGEDFARRAVLCLALCLGAGFLSGSSAAYAQPSSAVQGFAACRIISDDQARLNCLKQLSAPPAQAPSSEASENLWPLVVTGHPKGEGRDAVAIMRTADTSRSDADLAGLIIRCADKPSFEVLLAVVRPLPPRAKRDVVISSGSTQSILHAEISSLGTGVILPIEATAFTTGPWHGLRELTVAIKDPEADIRGVIPLDGLGPAMNKLSARCRPG